MKGAYEYGHVIPISEPKVASQLCCSVLWTLLLSSSNTVLPGVVKAVRDLDLTLFLFSFFFVLVTLLSTYFVVRVLGWTLEVRLVRVKSVDHRLGFSSPSTI